MLEVGGSDGSKSDRGGYCGATAPALATAGDVSVERGLTRLVLGSGYQAPNYDMRYSQDALRVSLSSTRYTSEISSLALVVGL